MKQLLSLSLVLLFSVSSAFGAQHDFFTKKPEGVVYSHGFLKGVASSTYQNGGHNYWESLGYKPESNWTWFENKFHDRFDQGEKVGISADVWRHMFADIQLIKNLNCNAHRFEIPWTDLNPEQGVWNEEAFELFDKYIDALLENGIEPIITLYHWVHPRWFHDLGAWEKEENISHFVHYAQEVFSRYGHKVKYWCTINEPTVVSVCGYTLGTHAPGKKDHASMLRPFCKDFMLTLLPHHYDLAGTVLGNLFKAHIEAYEAIKKLPNGQTAQVAIVHQAAHFSPLLKSGIGSLVNPVSRMLARYFNKNFAHAAFMQFFTTGHFKYDLPGGKSIEFIDERAPKSLDFIGLNFYADMFFGPGPACHEGEEMSDMIMWAIRPQAMYRAIQEISALKVPIIITENGICDAKDDRREKWIVGYNNAVKKAIDDGYDVRGYCYWSLLDNYEWNMGYSKKFGLYAVDTVSDDPTKKERTLRAGAEAYRDYVRVASLA